MRKITRQSVESFLAEEEFTSSNTAVIKEKESTYLTLHGNVIAKKRGKIIYITLAGWNTNTTKERLNGLLEMLGYGKIYQKDFQPYLDGKLGTIPIDNNEWYRVK